MRATRKVRESFIKKIDEKMKELGWPKGKYRVLHRFSHNRKSYRLVLEKRPFPCGLSVRVSTQIKRRGEWLKIACCVSYL